MLILLIITLVLFFSTVGNYNPIIYWLRTGFAILLFVALIALIVISVPVQTKSIESGEIQHNYYEVGSFVLVEDSENTFDKYTLIDKTPRLVSTDLKLVEDLKPGIYYTKRIKYSYPMWFRWYTTVNLFTPNMYEYDEADKFVIMPNIRELK